MSSLLPEDLKKRADRISATVVVVQLGGSLAPVFVAAALPPGFATIVCWLLAGCAFNSFTNLMHETAHELVFRAGERSRALGRWVLGPLLLSDFDAYVRRHWEHHRRLGESSDPKLAYRVPLRRGAMVVFALRCLVGSEALSKLHLQSAARPPRSMSGWRIRTAAVQAVLFALLWGVAFAASGGTVTTAFARAGIAWAFVYAYGLASLTIFLATLRAVAEHQLYPEGGDAPREGEAALRNFRCNALTRFLFGAYGFGEHFTHHRFPQVPYYRLLPLTARLATREDALEPIDGYVATLRRLTT